jgi:hypothetical protein
MAIIPTLLIIPTQKQKKMPELHVNITSTRVENSNKLQSFTPIEWCAFSYQNAIPLNSSTSFPHSFAHN